MKKTIALLLSLVMILTSFSVMTISATDPTPADPQPGTDAYMQALDQAGYTAISNFDQVTDYNGKYYLTADVTIPDTDASKYLVRGSAFTGILDGNAHIVYNTKYQIFTTLQGTMKNLTFSKFTSADETEVFKAGDPMIGGIGNGAVLENIVTNRTYIDDISDYWGAIVREVPENAIVTFKNVTNNSSIAYPYVGFNIKIGGFVGLAKSGCTINFENCVNNGNVKGSQAGGFIAVLLGGNTISFKNCTNNGTILGSIGKDGSNREAARGIAGGFIGGINNFEQRNATLKVSLEGCTNAGDVLRWEGAYSACTKDYKVTQGGFIGNLGSGGEATNPLQLSIKNCKVTSCYVGATTAWQDKDGSDYTQGYVGAIIGWLGTKNNTDNITIENVTVSNVKIESADPEYASLFLNTDGTLKTVVLKNCIAAVCEGATSAATGNVKFTNDGSSTAVTVNKTQKSAIQDGKMSLRFLGGIDTVQYTSIGFIVKKTVGDDSTYYFLFARTVYEEVNDGSNKLAKANFNDYYISAMILEGVSATENATYTVTPYAIDLDGNAVVGVAKSITLNNGTLS